MGRDPLGSTKKRIKYTAKRTIVIQTDRCAFKTQNSSLTRPFCSNRLLFGDDDGDDGDDGDGRCGVVDFFIILLSPHVTTPQLTAFQHARGRMPHHIVPRTERTDVTNRTAKPYVHPTSHAPTIPTIPPTRRARQTVLQSFCPNYLP